MVSLPMKLSKSNTDVHEDIYVYLLNTLVETDLSQTKLNSINLQHKWENETDWFNFNYTTNFEI